MEMDQYIATTVKNGASSLKGEHDQEREWSELLPDVLHLVSKRLPDLTDFARFRVVCKNWRSEAPLSDLPSQFPWLLISSGSPKNQLQFYSLSHGKFQTMSVPECHGKELMGPSRKYVFASDRTCSSLALFNPLTSEEVPLPPIDLDWCFPISTSQNCTDYVAICGGKTEYKIQTLGLCRPGDDKWTVIRKALEGCLMIYHKGMFFVYSPETRTTEVIEVKSGVIVTTVPPPPTKLNCLVESCGELLGISCNRSLNRDGDCKIYRLNCEGKNCKWVKISSIGDQMLFLDGGQGFSISASGSIQSERNCIFYLGSHELIKFDGVSTTYYLSKYDIESRSWEKISLPSMEKPVWFLPSH
ncbi:F-box family protein [Rhynchospora pubera]|uniref:F-box family protein n=1 Tax=Rhynchospora pubera TaxID=906938 RepID=A0AAV8GDT8_9POAL|nr:F-box family protein [Rhynchospora pubera]